MKKLKSILLSPLAILRLILILLLTGVLTLITTILYKIFGFSLRLQRTSMSIWGRTIFFICGIRIDHNELPKQNNFILMPNHRSYLDIFIVSGLTPSAPVAKVEMKKWPFMAAALKTTNAIIVDRKDPRSLVNTMKQIKNSVEKGIPVNLFPEATTYVGPLTKPFKPGSFKIAADAGIPIIPMAIDFRDKNDAWVGDDKFVPHFIRQMGKPITHVTVRYGEALVDSDQEKLRNTTREQIDKMLSEIQSS